MKNSTLERVISDFFISDRLTVLSDFFTVALESGYGICSASEFFDSIISKSLKRSVINRHDIDSHTVIAKKIFDLEREIGVTGSYYFRNSTLDHKFAREIDRYGSEVGYHFEELATLGKRYGWRSSKDVSWESAQELFRENFHRFQDRCGFKVRSVASHGDFWNRKTACFNWQLLTTDMKRSLGIDFEVYDSSLTTFVDVKISDCHYPRYWLPHDPLLAIDENFSCIELLTHPNHWASVPFEAFSNNSKRVIEELLYRARTFLYGL